MTGQQQHRKGVIPNFCMAGRAREAIEVWKRAFDAEEIAAHEENGHLRHAEVKINDGFVFLTDFSMAAMDGFQPSPSIIMHLEVPDGSDWMARGKAAGCTVITAWQDMIWGSFGRLEDPFGIIWNIASPKPGF